MKSVHERRIVAHFGRERPKEVPNLLLMLDVNLKVANENDAAIGADCFLPATKFAGFHVTFHDVDAVFLIERDSRDFVKADNVILTNKATLAG